MKRTHFAPLAISTLLLAACSGPPSNQFSQGTGAVSQTAGGGPDAEAGSSGHDGVAASGAAQGGAGGAPDVPEAGGTDPGHSDAGMGGSSGTPTMMAACAPEPEVCNGKDDDCDGVVDESCPVGISAGNAIQRKSIGDSFGGADFADNCSEDEFLVGLNVGVGAWLDQLTAICQKYSLHTDTLHSPYRYELAFGSKRSLVAHHASAASPVQELSCRGGTVMVGVRITQQHSALGQSTDMIVIPRIWIKCAEPGLSLSGTSPQVVWESAQEVGPVSGSFANSEAWFEGDLLGGGELLVGLHGAAGSWIDRVGLTASPLNVSLKAQ